MAHVVDRFLNGDHAFRFPFHQLDEQLVQRVFSGSVAFARPFPGDLFLLVGQVDDYFSLSVQAPAFGAFVLNGLMTFKPGIFRKSFSFSVTMVVMPFSRMVAARSASKKWMPYAAFKS